MFGDSNDSWDSTPTQEVFLQNYFRKDEPPKDTVTKKSRKRTKHPLFSNTASTSLMSNNLENKTDDLPKQNSLNKKFKYTSISGLETVSVQCNNEDNMTDCTVTSYNKKSEFKPSKPSCPKIKMFAPKSSNISKEISDCTKKTNKRNVIGKSSKGDLQNNNSTFQKVKKYDNSIYRETSQNMSSAAEATFPMKTTETTSVSEQKYLNNDSDNFRNKVSLNKLKILKKRQLKGSKARQILNKPSAVESNVKTKMLKAIKKTKNPEENGLNIHNSGDSEDEVMRIEEQNVRKRKSKTSKPTNTDESGDVEKELIQDKKHNIKKEKSKASKPSQIHELDESEDEVSQNEMQKLKKNKSKTGKVATIENTSNMNEANFKLKKAKSTKKSLNSNENCLNEDNSEDDEVIRNELQNTRMFLKIQKLMKVAPHLNPNFNMDSPVEEDDLSFEEISTENSSSESDGKYSSESENEEVLKSKLHQKIIKDSPKGNLDDTSDNEELDSSDNDDIDSSDNDDIDSSESAERDIESPQTTHKQEITLQKFESHNQKTSTVRKPNSMLEKARAKMAAAKFRFLNEKLYTESGGEAFHYFQENKEEFEDYHLGYGQQVSKWPLNPVDVILADLQKMNKTAVIADLGCGDAKIARVLTSRTVHSFDLVALHKCVTPCDISKVPLRDCSVDVAVFCLSLMGVNLKDYLCEAYRILKMGGTLKIAEVESRIVDLDLFIRNLNSLGFVLERKNTKNKLFVFLDLKKVKKGKASKTTTITLRPCMYKKR